MQTMILNRLDVKDLLNMRDVISVVENAFKEWAQGKGTMPAKAYLVVERGDFRAMPAALPGAAGMKWVNVHPENSSQGLPSIMAVLIYNDVETGYPLAIMDATEITAYRTAASAAIASKYLARKDSNSLGIIGAGHQAYTQILGHAELFDLELIKVFDFSQAAIDKLIKALPNYPIREYSLEETVASDIVCTLTPSRIPYLKQEWIVSGTHINAIGADAEGKEELEPSILKEAILVVDDRRQAIHAGEINVPISKGLFSDDKIYANLGEIIVGSKPGRIDDEAITVFDSTGVAIEDIAVAKLIFEKAKKKEDDYLSVDFVVEQE
jgi:alanine dehydrogenase